MVESPSTTAITLLRSIDEDVHEYFREKWEKNKKEYKIKYGVTSFSGFVIRILYEMLEREKQSTQ